MDRYFTIRYLSYNVKDKNVNILVIIYLLPYTFVYLKVGINKILEPDNSGLEGILKNNTISEVPVHLSKAKQKVFIDIDEMGPARHLPNRGKTNHVLSVGMGKRTYKFFYLIKANL